MTYTHLHLLVLYLALYDDMCTNTIFFYTIQIYTLEKDYSYSRRYLALSNGDTYF